MSGSTRSRRAAAAFFAALVAAAVLPLVAAGPAQAQSTPTVPSLVSSQVNGTVLVVEFSEALDGGSVPGPGAFFVSVGLQPRAVAAGGVAVSGKRVTLTLSSAAKWNEVVFVSYTKPTGDAAMPLQNVGGVGVESFELRGVVNNTAAGIESVSLVSKPRATDASVTPAIKVYGAGQAIVAAVTWEDPVSWDLSADGAGIRVRLRVGANNRSAELVTDGNTSGTARTLWFRYDAVSGDTDADGVGVAQASGGRLVLLRSGAKLKDAEGRNAGVAHDALGDQSGHKAKGSLTPSGNSVPTFDTDDDPDTDNTDLGTRDAPPGALIVQHGLSSFADADQDNLRFTIAATRPDALETHRFAVDPGSWSTTLHGDCVLEDLEPALGRNAAGQFVTELTLTAHDPDGASVTLTQSLTTAWNCGEFVSASVDGTALTLTYSRPLPPRSADSAWFDAQTPDRFQVNVDGATAPLAQTSPVTISGTTITLTLATAVTRNQTVTVTYNPAGLQRLRGITNQPVTNTLNTVPTAATMNANTLTVTFSRNVSIEAGGTRPNLARAFSANGVHWGADIDDDGITDGGVPLRRVAPESASVSGDTVTLTFGSDISPGRQATVDYNSGIAQTLGAGLLDAQSIRVPSVKGQAVTATLAATVPPLLVSGQVAGTELTLTFDSDLDTSGTAPPGDRFSVTAQPVNSGAPPRSVVGTGTATVSGKTVTVTLASPVAQRETATVWYRPSTDTTRQLRSAPAGPPAKAVWGSLVTVLDRTPPVVVDRVVAGNKLVLYFSEKLDTTSAPAAGDFAVTVAGSASAVSAVALSEDAVTLTLASSVSATETVTLGYAVPGTSPIQDLAGNDAASFSGRPVTNAGPTDPGAPSLTAAGPAVTDRAVLRLTFNRPLDPAKVPPASAFTIGGTDSRHSRTRLSMRVIDVAVRGSRVDLAVGAGFHACVTGFTVSYARPSENALANVWGTEAISFSGRAVANPYWDQCGRTSVSMTATGNAGGNSGGGHGGVGGNSGADGLSLGFGRSMNRLRAPSPSGFSVRSQLAGGAAAAAVSVSGTEFSSDGTRLVLALSRRLGPGERVSVSYSSPLSGVGLWDADGNQVAPFSAEAVVPGAAPAVTGVEVVSDAGDDGTYALGEVISLRVSFSEAVVVTGAPTLGIDMDPAHWGRKDAVYVSGSGSAVLTFAHEVVWPNFSSLGVAVLGDTLALAGGAIQAAAGGADAELAHGGLGHDPAHKVDWRRSSPADGNRAPVFGGVSDVHDNALPGHLVTLAVSEDDFSDPDGDALAFSVSASRDDVAVTDGFGYMEGYGRVWFRAKTACALAELDPPAGDAYDTVITLTATDPDGASASATATFRTDPTVYACPALSSAAVDGSTLTITLTADGTLPFTFRQPTADEFAVTADGSTVALAAADAVSVSDTEIVLTLASPVAAGQTVAVSYTPGEDPMAAAFADQPAANNTPAPEQPAVPDKLAELEEPDPSDQPAPDDTAAPTSAAVSGNELTLTFDRDLAAIDDTTAATLRWYFLVNGARDRNGNPVDHQSPSHVAVDANTLTLTLGTAITPGHDITVTYYSGLHDTNGTAVAGFTVTLTTTQRE